MSEIKADLLIIGAGAAGLSAGIYGARHGLKTLILEEKVAGGMTATAPLIENYPGFIKLPGIELMDKISEHATTAGAEIIELSKIIRIENLKENFFVYNENGDKYSGNALILAMGSEYRKLNVPGEKEFLGRGVSYCATCDGPAFKNKNVVVVGGSYSAAVSSIYLSQQLKNAITLVHRRDKMRTEQFLVDQIMSDSNINKKWNFIVKEIKGKEVVEKITIQNVINQEIMEIEADGIFVNVGELPKNELAKQLRVNLDKDGFIIVNRRQETNIPGVFAAGDITGGLLQTIVGAGEGATAAVNAYLYIKGGWYI
ncbi:MAG: FAD-binding protein [Candidatus Lokiarchaeota archaeon]|nr:FAD-binding protein [Candidatus Lokiarchaeota archaeon]